MKRPHTLTTINTCIFWVFWSVLLSFRCGNSTLSSFLLYSSSLSLPILAFVKVKVKMDWNAISSNEHMYVWAKTMKCRKKFRVVRSFVVGRVDRLTSFSFDTIFVTNSRNWFTTSSSPKFLFCPRFLVISTWILLNSKYASKKTAANNTNTQVHRQQEYCQK